MRSKNRKSDITSLSDAMGDLLKDFRLEDKYNESKLIADWEKIMGSAIAQRTTRLYIRDRVLYISVESAPLRHELSISKDLIIRRLEEEAGVKVVDDIRIYH